MKSKRLELLFLFIPILIACIQVTLSKTSNLVSWRGGGFGMYSDPHPYINRKVWVKGMDENDSLAVRLFPIDERFNYDCLRNTPFSRDLEQLSNTAKSYRNFPSRYPVRSLEDSFIQFIELHKDEELVKSMFPKQQLSMVVTLLSITKDFEHLGVEVIAEKQFLRSEENESDN